MRVSLTEELEQFVLELVKSGRYTSASEVVSDGIRLLAQQDRGRQLRLKEIRHELQIALDQLDSGQGIPSEELFDDLKSHIVAGSDETD